MVGWHHRLMHMILRKLWAMVKDREARRAAVPGVAELDTTEGLSSPCHFPHSSRYQNFHG